MSRITDDTSLKSFITVIDKILATAAERGGIHKLSKEESIYFDQLSSEVKAYKARRSECERVFRFLPGNQK